METKFSEKSNKYVKHEENTSSLHKRRPSRDENEKFHSQLESRHSAAKLRMSSSDEKIHSFHTPVEFSWSQFWVTFVYENLPPVFLSPLAAIIFERSLVRGWHVSQHRQLFAVSTKHNPIFNIQPSRQILNPTTT